MRWHGIVWASVQITDLSLGGIKNYYVARCPSFLFGWTASKFGIANILTSDLRVPMRARQWPSIPYGQNIYLYRSGSLQATTHV